MMKPASGKNGRLPGITFASLVTLSFAGTGGDAGIFADVLLPSSLGAVSIISLAVFRRNFVTMLAHCGYRITLAALWGFVMWMIASAAWSDPTELPVTQIVKLSSLALASTAASVVWGPVPQRHRSYLWGLLGLLALVALTIAILEGIDTLGRFSPLTMGPNTFARLQAAAFIAFAWLGMVKGQNFYSSAALIFFFGVWLAGSRGVLVSLVVTLCVFLPLAWQGYKIPPKRAGITVVAGAIVALGLSFPPSLTIGEVEPASTDGLRLLTVSQATSDDVRLVLLDHAIGQFKLEPLFGIGLNGFAKSFSTAYPDLIWDGAKGSYAHNLFFAVAAEGGLVGLGLLAWIFAYPVFLATRRSRLSVNQSQLLVAFRGPHAHKLTTRRVPASAKARIVEREEAGCRLTTDARSADHFDWRACPSRSDLREDGFSNPQTGVRPIISPQLCGNN